MTSERKKRTTLILPEELWRELKIQAVREGRELQVVVAEALGGYLKKVKKAKRDER